jgi:predicted dinucleotide-binding enzyme
MRIAIIGTGNVGGALAQGLAGNGHDLVLGARRPDAPEVAALAAATGATAALPDAAAAAADLVILALPWSGAEAAVRGLGDLSGRIVVDCMNPLGMTADGLGLTMGFTTSGGETVAGWLPGARVVKTLNQVGAELMARNDHLPARPVMFMAGDDAAAKTAVAGVLRDLGFAPQDAGPLVRARLLEPFGMLWISQMLNQGAGRNWAFTTVAG